MNIILDHFNRNYVVSLLSIDKHAVTFSNELCYKNLGVISSVINSCAEQGFGANKSFDYQITDG